MTETFTPTDGRLGSRFRGKIEVNPKTGCWEWGDTLNESGYGRFWPASKDEVLAHRHSYEALVGPIADGMVIDHLCRVRRCVNPGHLEQVTQAENTRRGDAGAHNAAKTHCPQGHEYTPENTTIIKRSKGGTDYRRCRACHREKSRQRRALNRAPNRTHCKRGTSSRPRILTFDRAIIPASAVSACGSCVPSVEPERR